MVVSGVNPGAIAKPINHFAMNVKNITFLTEGNDRKKGERYCICSFPPTFHCLPCNLKQAVKDLVKNAGYDLVVMNEDYDALLCKNTYRKAGGRYRYEWRYIAVQ